MREVQFLETPVSHVSDRVTFFEATGYFAADFFPAIERAVEVTPVDQPADLQLRGRGAQLALIRRYPTGMRTVIAGRADEADMQLPEETPYVFVGTVKDEARLFNPRHFAIDAGGRTGHYIPIFRSPMGTRLPSAGAILGNLAYQNGAPASWAVITAQVTPTLGGTLSFRAQADVNGDFIVPLNRMPALNKDAPTEDYAAELSVMASATYMESGFEIAPVPDIDSFVAFQVKGLTSGGFDDTTALAITPNRTARIVSAGSQQLIIRPAP